MSPTNDILSFWEDFVQEHPEHANLPCPDAWHFCNNEEDANECLDLVLKGIKKATSPNDWWFEHSGEEYPYPGLLSIVTNWNGTPKAIIETTQIDRIPFKDITEEHAKIEGEGDQSLEYWRRVHWQFFNEEMVPRGATPTEDMIIVFEQFQLIWPKS